MKRNAGTADRIIRILIGLAALGAGYYYQNWLGLIGLVPLFTGLVGWCALYPLLGISTCKRQG